MSSPLLEAGLYRHYKGGLYRVLMTALHTETEETLVVYQSDQNGAFYARPLMMFTETVHVNGRDLPRFEFLST